MTKNPLDIPDLFTMPDEVCYGFISVYPQEVERLDPTSLEAEEFEKYVPAIRAVCFNAPRMYKLLREIVAGTNSSLDSAKELVNDIERATTEYGQDIL